MNALTVISTDLLTPLGAYLRLRDGGRASFLLESVEKGRLGRHSFVGCGARIVGLDQAEGGAALAASPPPAATPMSRGASRLSRGRPMAATCSRAVSLSPRRSSASTTGSAWPRSC